MKRKNILITIFSLMILMFGIPHFEIPDPGTNKIELKVGNDAAAFSTIASGVQTTYTQKSQQHKMWYDGTYWWTFYQTAAAPTSLIPLYSKNLPPTWTALSAITLPANTVANGGALAIWYDNTNCAGQGCFLSSYYTTTANELRYLNCVPTSIPTISCSSTALTIETDAGIGSSSPGTDYQFSFTLDSTNRPYLLVPTGNNGNLKRSVATSALSTSFADDTAVWTTVNFNASAQYTNFSAAFDVGARTMMAISGGGTSGTTGTQYVNYAIDTNGTVGSWTDILDHTGSADGLNWGVTQVGKGTTSDVYFLGISNTGTGAMQFSRYRSAAWSNLTAPAAITNGITLGGGISCVSDTSNVYCFTIRNDGSKTLSYNKYSISGGTWLGWTTIETTTNGSYVQSAGNIDTQGNIPVIWTSSAGVENFSCITTAGATCSLINYSMNVSPTTGFSGAGFAGGPFSPANASFTITNGDSASITCSISALVAWVSVSTNNCGTLAVSGTATFNISFNAATNALAAGTYTTNVVVTNLTSGRGTQNIPVTLTVTAVSGGGGGSGTGSVSTPVLFFSDITSGPATGNGDGSGSGAIVTIWGANLGSTQGSSTVSVGGVATDHVYCWGNADASTCGLKGTSPALYNGYQNYQAISFSVPSTAVSGSNTISVTVGGVASNTLAFTVRAGRICYVKTTGTNTAGNCSYASPWQTLTFVGNGATLLAGDIVYVQTGVTETNGWVLRGITQASQALPISFIAYPGAQVIIQHPTQSSGFGMGNNNGNNLWLNFSKFTVQSNGDGIQAFWGMRAVGNEITNYPAGCATGSGGAVAGSDLNGTHTAGGGIEVLGNYIHDFGCNTTSGLHHTFYISNRSGNVYAPYELAYNYVTHQKVRGALHNYDEGVCGGWSGPIKEHHNVVWDNWGEGVGAFFSCNSPVTTPIQIYDNLFIDCAKDISSSDDNNYCISFQGPNTQSAVSFYNNTVVGFGGSFTGITGAGPGALFWLNNGGSSPFGGTFSYYNNIVVDTKGTPWWYTQCCPMYPTTHGNNLWWSTYATQNPPAFDNGAIYADPLFTAGTYNPGSLGPGVGHGTSTVSAIVADDLNGTGRAVAAWDIGVYQFLAGSSGSGGGGGGGTGSTPASITVSPASGLTYAGNVSNIVTPQTVTFTLTNTSNSTPVNFTVTKAVTWAVISTVGSTIQPGTSVTFTYGLSSPAANNLAAGNYLDGLSITNTTNGNGSTVIPVALLISSIPTGGGPTVSPTGTFTWIPVPSAFGYKVYVTLTANGATQQLRDMGLNSCTTILCRIQLNKIFGLLNGTSYFISVSSYNDTGESAKTPQLQFTYGANVPSVPSAYTLHP